MEDEKEEREAAAFVADQLAECLKERKIGRAEAVLFVNRLLVHKALVAFAATDADNELVRLRGLVKANNDLARMNGADRTRLVAENASLKDAIEYAHSRGFEWPSDPLAAIKDSSYEG